MMISLLLLVPLTTMGLVFGLSRLEDTLLRAPAVPAEGAQAPTATVAG